MPYTNKMPQKSTRPRIWTLDLLRGYFLFVVIIDHAAFFPSIFEFTTGRGQLWASAAEGFFIISGLLVGYIYGPRMAQNVKQATKKIWKRAFLLYGLTVFLTFLFVWWGNNSDITHVKEGLWIQPHIGEFLFKVFTLQYYYGWADFLPHYAIFMVFAPLALYACVKRLGWLVLAVSCVCWLFRGNSFEMAWQLLFMSSLVAGWYLPQIEATWRAFSPVKKKWLLIGVYGLAVLLVVVCALSIRVAPFMLYKFAGFDALPGIVQSFFVGLDSLRQMVTPFIIKWSLEPLRLVTAIVWFTALYLFVRRNETTINRLSRGFFKSLGERSLIVYVAHSFVIFGLMLVVTTSNWGFVMNSFLGALVVGGVYGIAILWPRVVKWIKSIAIPRLQFNREKAS